MFPRIVMRIHVLHEVIHAEYTQAHSRFTVNIDRLFKSLLSSPGPASYSGVSKCL